MYSLYGKNIKLKGKFGCLLLRKVSCVAQLSMTKGGPL